MEIVSLRFVATDDDLNSFLAKLVTASPKICDLRIRVIQNALSVTGVYKFFLLPIPFESFWSVSICDGRIAAQFSGFKVGVRLDFLKGYVLDAIGSKTNLL